MSESIKGAERGPLTKDEFQKLPEDISEASMTRHRCVEAQASMTRHRCVEAQASMTRHRCVEAQANLNAPDTFKCSCGFAGQGLTNWRLQFIEHLAREVAVSVPRWVAQPTHTIKDGRVYIGDDVRARLGDDMLRRLNE